MKDCFKDLFDSFIFTLLFLGIIVFICFACFSLYEVLILKNMNVLGFFGSVIGGFLTLVGVWWTIKDQDKKRKEDLAIQYKPFLKADIDTNTYKQYSMQQFNQSKFNDTDTFNGVLCLQISKNCDYLYELTIIIHNYGDGECYIKYNNTCIETDLLLCKVLDAKDFSKAIDAECITLDKSWETIIPRKDKIIIKLFLLFNQNEIINCNYIDLLLKMTYNDQFKYNLYDGSFNLKFQLEKKDDFINITNPMFIIYNHPIEGSK